MGVLSGVCCPGTDISLQREVEDMLRTARGIAEPAMATADHGAVCLGALDWRKAGAAQASPAPLEKWVDQRRLIIVCDARIDNRVSLARTLNQPTGADIPCDRELILLAYLRWGTAVPGHLLGDFAFALWDEANQALFCARDHLGIKPFFYSYKNGKFAFASCIRGLLAHPMVNREFCDEAVAIYLARSALMHPSLCFYKDLQSLPPGNSLLLDASGIHVNRYWSAEGAPDLPALSESDCIDQLEALLRSAVDDRAQGELSVASHLSGGLDSSLVSVVAAEKQANLKLYSWFSEPATAESREEALPGETIARHVGGTIHYTNSEFEDYAAYLGATDIALQEATDSYYESRVRQHMYSNGIQIVLSGWGGDEIISNPGLYRYFETFWSGQALDTLRDIGRCYRNHSVFRLGPAFILRILRELLQPGLLRLGARLSQQTAVDYSGCANDRIRALSREYAIRSADLLALPVREDQLKRLQLGHLQARIQAWAQAGCRYGLEYRFPLLDKRIVEFALGVPAQMYRKEGQGRYLFRQTASRVLPASVWKRSSKREPVRVSDVMAISIRALKLWECNELPDIGENDYIDPDKLRKMIRALPDTSNDTDRDTVTALQTIVPSVFVLTMGSGNSIELTT